MVNDIETIDWGTGHVDLRDRVVVEMRCDRIHLKRDGSLNDGPVLTFELAGLRKVHVVHQVSVEMLNEALNELGFELKRMDDAEQQTYKPHQSSGF